MIKIKVDGQSAHKLNTPVIASGAVNFLFLQAEFSSDWDGLNKSYVFTNGDVCIQIESDGDKVAVPVEVLTEGEFTVGIKGIRLGDKKDSVEVKATHNALTYRIQPSGIDGLPQNAGTLTPSVTEQLRDVAQNLGFIGGVIVQGSGEASGKTQNSNAIGDYSMALGDGVTAGRKGYYIKSIDKSAKKIYLSETQVTPVFSSADNTDLSFTTPAFDAGDEFSVINHDHYILCAKIVSAKNNVITYSGDLPFNSFPENPGFDDYTFSVPSKPEIGSVTLGKSAFSTGEGNSAAGRSSFAAGRDNVAAGNFSMVSGRNNKVGYAGHVSGFGNTALGSGAHAEGYYNTINGEYSHAEGYRNTVNGNLNTVGGAENTVTGNLHDVSGRYNVVEGNSNVVHGYKNIASGDYQFITGLFNADDPNKVFIVGRGSSEYARKNIMSLDKNGNMYLTGKVISPLADDYLYVFDNYRMLSKFVTHTYQVTLSCYQRSMKAVSMGIDPQIYHDFAYPLDGTKYPYIKLRYRIEGFNSGEFESLIYFTTKATPDIVDGNRALFNAVSDGGWHDIIIDMSQNEYWDDAITMLRFDILNPSKSGAAVYFKYIGLFHDMDEAQSFEL